MFASIRKHQSWLMTVIMGLTIFTFVALYTNGTGFNNLRNRGASPYGTIDGRPIEEGEYFSARRVATLFYYVHARSQWPDDELVNRLVPPVLFVNNKINTLGIQIDEHAVAERVSKMGPDGKAFSVDQYHAFLKNVLEPKSLTEDDFIRYVRFEIAQQYLEQLYGTGSVISPRAIESRYRVANEEIATEAAFFSRSNYVDKVSVTTNALQEFFKQKQANYAIPARVQVNYISFEVADNLMEASKQMAKETNLTQQIDGEYLKRGPTNFVDAAGKVLPEAQAKEQIKDTARHDLALHMARKQANDFASALDDMKPSSLTNFYQLAAAKKYKVYETEPFSMDEGPKDTQLPPLLAYKAFNLSEQEPFTSPILSSNAVYVIAFKRKIDSQLQPLEAVQAKVKKDFVEAKSLELAVAAGKAFKEQAAKQLAQGKTFAEACAVAKQKYEQIPPFSPSSREMPKIPAAFESRLFVGEAMQTGVGKLSDFVDAGSGGFVLYVKAHLPVSEQKLKTDLPAFAESQREGYQGRTFDDWLNRQLKSSVNMPLLSSSTRR